MGPSAWPHPDDQLEREERHDVDHRRRSVRPTDPAAGPGYESPEQYVAAWQRIVGIFRAEAADNVSWVWCPNASAFNDGEAQKFYPGDDFVDWTCADGYNWAPGRPGEAIKTDFPLLRAIVYFHANKDHDWRLTTSDSALDAFRQLANDPWFDLGDNRRFLDGLRGGLGAMAGAPRPR